MSTRHLGLYNRFIEVSDWLFGDEELAAALHLPPTEEDEVPYEQRGAQEIPDYEALELAAASSAQVSMDGISEDEEEEEDGDERLALSSLYRTWLSHYDRDAPDQPDNALAIERALIKGRSYYPSKPRPKEEEEET